MHFAERAMWWAITQISHLFRHNSQKGTKTPVLGLEENFLTLLCCAMWTWPVFSRDSNPQAMIQSGLLNSRIRDQLLVLSYQGTDRLALQTDVYG